MEGRLARVLGLDESFQAGEAGAPETAVLLQPRIDGAQRLRIELVDAMAPVSLFPDEMRPAQQAKVLGNRRPGYGKGRGNLAGGLTSAAQQVEDGTSRRIGERLEGGLCRICNRTVTHYV